MKDGEGEDDDRTQRLVAELAEVRRRMSLRAIPVAPKSRADASGSIARSSAPPPAPDGATSSAPRPALGNRIPTQRIVIEGPAEDQVPLSKRPSRP
jgi:hypothetical protein